MTRLTGLYGKLRVFWAWIRGKLRPSDTAWSGAARAFQFLALALAVTLSISEILPDFSLEKAVGFVALILTLLAIGLGAFLANWLIGVLPSSYRRTLLLLAPFVFIVLAVGAGAKGSGVLLAGLIVLTAFAGGVGAVVAADNGAMRSWKTRTALGLSLGVLIGLGIFLFGASEDINPALADYRLEDRTLDLEDPATPGPYGVRVLTYGPDADGHRSVYESDFDVLARTVDASKLIDGWDGLVGWIRTSYWGFDPTALPLRGRVYMPDAQGTFPLVLVVHGNHGMEDFSDPGYDYLGELFASRGYIFTSVDENFLNSSLADMVNPIDSGLTEENDARGWLLLEHLRLWRDWSQDPDHVFSGKVDMDRLALIGHSRGGEAVATAAVFNELDAYPDDATLSFEYGFNLGGVIAIAPVDGQYKPRERGNPLRDVNYFVIHGSMDGDVSSFMGTSVYERARFSGDDFRFKASLYVDGANHGQFNTSWGRCDTLAFSCWWFLDTAAIMDPEEQRQVAKVYFSAFLEAVLEDNPAYLPIFSDPRRGAGWLPDNFFVANYADSNDQVLADFEEDLNPTTATRKGTRIAGDNLSRWREAWVKLKWAPLETHASLLAWDERVSELPASYAIQFPDSRVALNPTDVLVFSLSAASGSTLPDDWEASEEDDADEDSADGDGEEAEDDESKPLDWTIVLTDQQGQSAKLPLSFDSPLYPQVKGRTGRRAFFSGNSLSEIVLRRFSFPLESFVQTNPALDVSSLREIRFVFDLSKRGAVVLDDLAFASQNLPPAG